MARRKTLSALAALWREHGTASFPEGMAGTAVSGVCVTSLDTFTAGCIDTFIRRGGKLDARRTAVLGLCYRDLFVVVAKLKGEQRWYFARLEELARSVLEAVAAKKARS